MLPQQFLIMCCRNVDVNRLNLCWLCALISSITCIRVCKYGQRDRDPSRILRKEIHAGGFIQKYIGTSAPLGTAPVAQ